MLKDVAVSFNWTTSQLQQPMSRPAPDEDDKFLALPEERAAHHSGVHDYDRYANLPNDPTIKSALGWWGGNQGSFPDLAKMGRDTLAVPVLWNGCSVFLGASLLSKGVIFGKARSQIS